ncbi:MAG: hypothetical protein U5R06_23135 [candidate division KSB1 bacterium]|nr:hypothetical protein [candidate division KSB1 bacterium]
MKCRLTLHYTDDDVNGLDESRLAFFRYQNMTWQYVGGAATSSDNKLVIDLDQPGLYAVFEESLPRLNLRLFLEGLTVQAEQMQSVWAVNDNLPQISPYADQRLAVSVSADIVDWVSVSLRTAADGPDVWQRSYLLNTDGHVVDPIRESQPIRLPELVPGDYYAVIRHNAHLTFMSANSTAIVNSPVSTFDFSSSENSAYGSNAMKQMFNQTWASIGGDFNQDGLLNSLDYVQFYNAKHTADPAYNRHDISGDGVINYADRDIWLQNASQNYRSRVPSE